MSKMKKLLYALLSAVCAAALFVCGIFVSFSFNNNTVKAYASTVTSTIYWGVSTVIKTLDVRAYSVSGNYQGSFTGSTALSSNSQWLAYKNYIETVKINTGSIVPADTSNWFYGCNNLQTVQLSSLDTSNVTTFSNMFYGCSSLQKLDLSKLAVSKVKVMANMFRGCSALQSISLPSLSVTSATFAFYGCSNLSTLNLSKFTVSSSSAVTNMINGCSGLLTINLSASLAGVSSSFLFDTIKSWYDANGNEYTSSNPVTAAGVYYSTKPECQHTFDSGVITTAPTCVKEGVKTYSCTKCGETKTESVPVDTVNGHNYSTQFTVDTAATCTAAGSKSRHCAHCGGQTDVTAIDALGHDWSDWQTVTAATCTAAGSEKRSCRRAGCTLQPEERVINATGHSFVNYNSNNDATCLADGTKTAVCAHGCGTMDTIADAGSKLSHIWDTAWNKDGTNHWHECTRGCGTKNDDAAHSFSWVVDTPATVTTAGIKHEECICGERRSENTPIPIETCPHTNKAHVAAVAAICVTAGNVEYWHCNDCNKNLDASNLELATTVIPIDPSAHNWGAWVETVAPTYDADGEERRECQNAGCTHFETQVIPKKTKVQITVTIDPASSEVGAALETLTATVTSGTLIDPADVPYTLSTNADINTMGTYTITGVCTDSRYDITFIDGVYVVSKRADDPNGGGEIDLPVDINVEFKLGARGLRSRSRRARRTTTTSLTDLKSGTGRSFGTETRTERSATNLPIQ